MHFDFWLSKLIVRHNLHGSKQRFNSSKKTPTLPRSQYRIIVTVVVFWDSIFFEKREMSGKGKGAKTKAKAKSRSVRAGLQFPVGRVHRLLRKVNKNIVLCV